MRWETAKAEIEWLESERRSDEVALGGTLRSERDRRAHLQEWVDRRTAEIDELYDRRPLPRWARWSLEGTALAFAFATFVVEPFWPMVAVVGAAVLLRDAAKPGVPARRGRRVARTLTGRPRLPKAPRPLP